MSVFAQAQCFLAVAVVLLLAHTQVRPYKDAQLDRLTVAAVFGLNVVAVINVVSYACAREMQMTAA